MQRVLMVGCGKMGGAILRRWASLQGTVFTVVDPALDEPPAGASLYKSRSDLPDTLFDVVVLAVKPQMMADVAPGYIDLREQGGVFASIAAGTSIETLEEILGDAPVIRIMPNLPAEIGKGVTGLYANERASEPNKALVETLVRRIGEVVWVPSEDALDRFTAIAGSGPGYVFEIAREYIAAARRLGFSDDDARTMVLGVMRGSVELALERGEDVETLRDAVTSKNGTTEAGLNELMRAGALRSLFATTTEAAYARAVELR
ncbi:MAG: pyrroline-5-carboxylate reductase [Pseudomonadota bacterium]